MIDKFHTIEELKATGLKMIGSHISDKDIPIGEKYLSPEVKSMWDFSGDDDLYKYFDDGIKLIVQICQRVDSKTTKCEPLKRDLSNI